MDIQELCISISISIRTTEGFESGGDKNGVHKGGVD